jgi:hypothetical protein
MKKVLISGMTASQTSENLSKRTLSFSSALVDILRSEGVQVDWKDVSVHQSAIDINQYDAVILGIAPVLSLSANKPYGVLSLINELKNSDKLTLLVDAPEPSKIHASLRSVCSDHEKLTKSLYSRRKEYLQVTSNKKVLKNVISGAEFLLSQKWPTTLYPSFPWSPARFTATGLPESATDSFCGISIDKFYMTNSVKIDATRANRWVAESVGTKWTNSVCSSLMYPVGPVKEHRMWSDADAQTNISNAVGTLVGPCDDKLLWWSPRFFQSMNTLTPVATEWRTSEVLGNAWNHLAAGIEQLSTIDRHELAVWQREQYAVRLPMIEETKLQLKKEIGIN